MKRPVTGSDHRHGDRDGPGHIVEPPLDRCGCADRWPPPTAAPDVVSDSDSACAIIRAPSVDRRARGTRRHRALARNPSAVWDAGLDAHMTLNQKTPLPSGLPKRFLDGRPGFQRLQEFLEIPNTRAVQALLDAVKDAVRVPGKLKLTTPPFRRRFATSLISSIQSPMRRIGSARR